MALLKKVNPEWVPSENPDMEVGDTIEVTDYRDLVRSGAAILVDEEGNEIPLEGQVFACPICYKGLVTLADFVAHVESHKKVKPSVTSPEVSEEVLEEEPKEVEPKKEEVKVTETPTPTFKKFDIKKGK